ncbi:MAG: TfoX/Sxy family protein, partial [Chloroflexota bacterium]|nr:TfoX/Sxy family protein [Chloroflexota bacterium]
MADQDQFERLVAALLDRVRAETTYGAPGTAERAFGATSLKANGKIFAMLVEGRLVVKLSRARVDELVAIGTG